MTVLLIVESPSKAKSIAKYLGPGYIVKASVGHVRDLPRRQLGVDLNTLRPVYEVSDSKKQVVKGLKTACKGASSVLLATDPDREGEAIAFHLAELLKHPNMQRVRFNEITPAGVQQAIQHPTHIDRDKVAAQEGRRVLDRLVGYQVSPLLGQHEGRWLSAGRVQSVVLLLLHQRQQAINSFSVTKHFGAVAKFTDGGAAWEALWDAPLARYKASAAVTTSHDGKLYWTDSRYVDAMVSGIKRAPTFHVMSVKRGTRSENAPSPFTTSMLQQAANNHMGLGAKACMDTAQSLFEMGLITYHRTDNPNLSDDGASMVLQFLDALVKTGQYKLSIPPSPNRWKAGDGAQEAHEAIRPTDIRNLGKTLEDENQRRLYMLIWQRTVASQLGPVIYSTAQVALKSEWTDQDGQAASFIAKGQSIVDKGWRAMMPEDSTQKDADKDEDKVGDLPLNIAQGDTVSADDVVKSDKQTRPPGLYTEASLVNKMEAEGIGRPSTYASIIANILERGYVLVSKRKLTITDLGSKVCQWLQPRFSFMDLSFTRKIESQLDEVARGAMTYEGFARTFQQGLDGEIRGNQTPLFGSGDFSHKCPECGAGLGFRPKGKFGPFWACTNYPGCRVIVPDNGGSPDFEALPVDTGVNCPTCQNGHLIKRKGKRGFYLRCSDRECKHTEDARG